jgi:hypothetical protein
VISTVVTVVVLLVVFVGIFPKVADYSEAWASIQQMPSAYVVALVMATVVNLAVYVWPMPAALPGLGLRARVRRPPDLVRHQQRRAGRRGGRAGRAVRHTRLLRVRRRSGRGRYRDRERLQRLRHSGHAGPGGPGAVGRRRSRGELPADGGDRVLAIGVAVVAFTVVLRSEVAPDRAGAGRIGLSPRSGGACGTAGPSA